MPAAKPVVLDHKTFDSQNKARKHYSGVLHRYEVGQTVSEADKAELESLLKHHPLHNASAPIDHIVVTRSGFGRDCFATVRPDSSVQRLSFVACIRHSVRPSGEEDAPEPQQKQTEQIAVASSAPEKSVAKRKDGAVK